MKDRSTQHASYRGVNRDLWDFWTELHTTVSEEYLEAMAQVRAGGTTLDDIVLSEVGDIHPIRRVLKPPRADATGTPVEIGYVARAEPVRFEERGSYSVPEHDSVHTAYYWQHGLGEIVTALCAAGLCLEFLHEFSKTERDVYAYSRAASGRMEAHLRHNVTMPRQFSIKAVRQGGVRWVM